MNSVLLRWMPSLNIRSKLKGQRKTIKFGSDTSLVPSLAQFEHFFLDTVPLKELKKTVSRESEQVIKKL